MVASNDNGALEKGIIMINILDAIHSLKPEYKTANISVTWNDNDTVADMDIDGIGVTPISNEDLQARV